MSSSVSSVTNSNNSNLLRLTGMATGIDTESMIQQLMQAERVPLDRLNQKKTTLEWKMDAYREIATALRDFQSEYFDILKPGTNMTSPSTLIKNVTSSTNPAVATATAGAAAQKASHTITVTNPATAATATSSASVSQALAGSGVTGLAFTSGVDNEFKITLNGVTKTITLRSGDYGTTGNLISNVSNDGIQNLVDAAFGAGKITVSETTPGSNTLQFATTNGRITLYSGTKDALAKLQFTNGASNKINVSDTLANLSLGTDLTFDGASELKFSINNVAFSFSSSTSLSSMMSQINNSSANVTMSYSELTDKFTLVSKVTGAGEAVNITNTGGNLFDAAAANSAIKVASGSINNGSDAAVNLDGVDITRSDNQFAIDGVAYTVLAPGTTSISISQDTDAVFNTIKGFVDTYNVIVGNINTRLAEKKYRDYTPLTEAQKADMKDTDITAWETKAKSGLLRSDSILQKAVTDMRRSLFDTISGVSGDLTQIGITTGDYKDKGKLVIDETKLRSAIATNPTKVQELFSKSSSIAYSASMSSTDRATRYAQEGIANRLSDILQDNIRTSRDANSKKGLLIEKAGIVGDLSEYSNLINTEIGKNNTAIADLTLRLYNKETAYYKKFSALETAVQRMNSQSSWISQQLGS